MIRFIALFGVIILILFILKKKSKQNKLKKPASFYQKMIIIVFVLGIVVLVATSGRFILPQLLQFLKIILPLVTKLIPL